MLDKIDSFENSLTAVVNLCRKSLPSAVYFIKVACNIEGYSVEDIDQEFNKLCHKIDDKFKNISEVSHKNKLIDNLKNLREICKLEPKIYSKHAEDFTKVIISVKATNDFFRG